MTKIRVPDGMMVAAHVAHIHPTVLNEILEAALRWLSEHPIVPSTDDIGSMQDLLNGYGIADWGPILCAEWQRRMLLAPEPEVPEEISDLIRGREDDDLIIEAYRRGQNSK
jgi:hypothetical protein